MTSAAFALLSRSLREDSRLKQTYLIRGGLVTFILFILYNERNSFRFSGAPGLSFFNAVILTNFFFISLAGLSYFSSAITEEKEEGTLGLLRMTNLGPLTILLGKSTSRLLGIACLLLVQVPFTLLAVTLGGVSTRQVLAAYVALASYIFLLSNLALLFSVVCSRVSLASVMTLIALLLFFFGPFWGGELLKALDHWRWLSLNSTLSSLVSDFLGHLERASVFGRLEAILTTGFAGPAAEFQVYSNLALGTVFFVIAWAGFDTFTRERHGGALFGWFPRFRLSRLPMLGARRFWPAPAVLWKDYFLVGGGWSGAAIRALLLLGLFALIDFNTDKDFFRGQQPTVYIRDWNRISAAMIQSGMLIFAVESAFAAARVFRVEIQGKTLSGLIGLPVPASAILYQKVIAAALSLVPTTLFLLCGFFLNPREYSHLDDEIFYMAVQGILFLHLTAYFSLWMKWMALPLAIAAMVFGNMCFIMSIRGIIMSSSDAPLVLYHLTLLGLAAFLHVQIGLRFRHLAAEEN